MGARLLETNKIKSLTQVLIHYKLDRINCWWQTIAYKSKVKYHHVIIMLMGNNCGIIIKTSTFNWLQTYKHLSRKEYKSELVNPLTIPRKS